MQEERLPELLFSAMKTMEKNLSIYRDKVLTNEERRGIIQINSLR